MKHDVKVTFENQEQVTPERMARQNDVITVADYLSDPKRIETTGTDGDESTGADEMFPSGSYFFTYNLLLYKFIS